MMRLLRKVNARLSRIPEGLPLLALRIAVAVPFFRSGLTKFDGFGLSAGARFLFEDEFRLHLGFAEVPFPFPVATAWMTGIAELALPILLVLGFGTRFVAAAILLMTLVIQLTVPEGWANFHLPWAAMALALVVFGGGPYAVERLLPQPTMTRRDRKAARWAKAGGKKAAKAQGLMAVNPGKAAKPPKPGKLDKKAAKRKSDIPLDN